MQRVACDLTAVTVRTWKIQAQQFLLGPEKQKTFSRSLSSHEVLKKHTYQDTITQYSQLAAQLLLAAVTVLTWNIHTQSLFLPEKRKTFSQQALACHEVAPKKHKHRLEICRDRRDRQSCKIFVSCVNFPGKQHNFWHNLRRITKFTHT